jgi:hypothetical protein
MKILHTFSDFSIKDILLTYWFVILVVIYFVRYFYFRLIKKYPSELEAMNKKYSQYPLRIKGIFAGLAIGWILFFLFMFYDAFLIYYRGPKPSKLSRNEFNAIVMTFHILCATIGYLIGFKLESHKK